MFKLNENSLALVFSILAGSSCFVNSPLLGANGKITADTIAGKWMASCHKATGITNNFVEEIFEFGPNKHFLRDVRTYTDKTCTSPILTESKVIEGTYEIGAPVKGQSDARDVNFTIRAVSSTAFGEAAERQFNESQLCSVSDWKRGEKRDVTGLLCKGEQLDVGTVIFDIAQLTDGKLYFGKKSFFRSGDSPKDRPREIDKDVTFTSASAMAH